MLRGAGFAQVVMPMQPVIKTLKIQHFRSILAEEIEFDNPTFLVGMNGAGKSNLVDAIRFLAETASSPLRAVLGSRGGIVPVHTHLPGISPPTPTGFAVEFGSLGDSMTGGRYAFALTPLPANQYRVTREQCLTVGADGTISWFERDEQGFRSNVDGMGG